MDRHQKPGMQRSPRMGFLPEARASLNLRTKSYSGQVDITPARFSGIHLFAIGCNASLNIVEA